MIPNVAAAKLAALQSFIEEYRRKKQLKKVRDAAKAKGEGDDYW